MGLLLDVMCAMFLLHPQSAGAQAITEDTTQQTATCRSGAYSVYGPDPIYVVGKTIVGGDSTAPGFMAHLQVYLAPDSIARIEVLMPPAAVERYGCRARSGAIIVHLKPTASVPAKPAPVSR